MAPLRKDGLFVIFGQIGGVLRMIFVSTSKDGDTVRFVDRKRYLWILSVLSPAVPGFCALFLFAGWSHVWAAFPLVFYFLFVPLLDMWIGEDMRLDQQKRTQM